MTLLIIYTSAAAVVFVALLFIPNRRPGWAVVIALVWPLMVVAAVQVVVIVAAVHVLELRCAHGEDVCHGRRGIVRGRRCVRGTGER